MTLIHLNHKIGFIHWDLHLGNLLINKKTGIEFLLYDFDLSETDSVKNDVMFERYGNSQNEGIDIGRIIRGMCVRGSYEEKKRLYGLVCDMLMYFLNCKNVLKTKFDVNKFSSPMMKQLYGCMSDLKYTDNDELFKVLIPLVCIRVTEAGVLP